MKFASICGLAMSAIAYACLGTAVAAPSPAPPAPRAAAPAPVANPVPAPEFQLIMIRNALAALNQANLTNNYTVLNGLGSDNFRAGNAPDKLAKTFESFRANKIDLAPTLYLGPQLVRPAAIEGGRLRMIGAFPSKPMQVSFDLTFEPSQGTWKIFGLNVSLTRPQAAAAPVPVAPAPAPAQPAGKSKDKK